MANDLCLWNETSIEIPKQWSSEGFWVGEHSEVLGGWYVQRKDGSAPSLPHTLPYIPLPADAS